MKDVLRVEGNDDEDDVEQRWMLSTSTPTPPQAAVKKVDFQKKIYWKAQK